MNLPKATLDYIDRPTPEGQRNRTLFDAAAQYRDAGATEDETRRDLLPCARRDGLDDLEASKTIHSAYTAPARDPIKAGGSRPREFVYRRSEAPGGINTAAPSLIATPRPSQAKRKYDLAEDPIPAKIDDGARLLLKAAFLPGENIAIQIGATDDDGHEHPKDDGVVLTFEDWMIRLDDRRGDPNRIFKSSDKNGIYIKINPFGPKGTRDADVTAFRHCLLEWDQLPLEQQWSLIRQSNIPCTAVLSSGGKSLHAWVKVDAKDREEWEERTKTLYDHFAEYGLDPQNKNPSRYSRLPNCERGNRRQELLKLHIGAPSFTDWMIAKQVEGLGEEITVPQLREYKTKEDPNNILGKRWLCKGGSCIIVGQSGTGKSSLAIQMATLWATGKDAWGIKPVRPLKSVIVQAENDMGDMAEAQQGIEAGLGLTPSELDLVAQNVIYRRDTTHTGLEFCNTAAMLIEYYHPDLFWIDPIFSFVGGDLAKTDICSQFFRNWLNPISYSTGVIWMLVHHTTKPLTDPKGRAHWTLTDFTYFGAGAAELYNWSRATCALRKSEDDKTYILTLAKRGERAGGQNRDQRASRHIWLQHAPASIHWVQVEEPTKPATDKSKDGVKTQSEARAPRLSAPELFLAHAKDFISQHCGQSMKAGMIIEKIRSFLRDLPDDGELFQPRVISDVWGKILQPLIEDHSANTNRPSQQAPWIIPSLPDVPEDKFNKLKSKYNSQPKTEPKPSTPNKDESEPF